MHVAGDGKLRGKRNLNTIYPLPTTIESIFQYSSPQPRSSRLVTSLLDPHWPSTFLIGFKNGSLEASAVSGRGYYRAEFSLAVLVRLCFQCQKDWKTKRVSESLSTFVRDVTVLLEMNGQG